MGRLVLKLFYALGGIVLWIWNLLMNTCMHKNKRTDLGHYLFEEFKINDNTNFLSEGIKLVLGIVSFSLITISLDYFN